MTEKNRVPRGLRVGAKVRRTGAQCDGVVKKLSPDKRRATIEWTSFPSAKTPGLKRISTVATNGLRVVVPEEYQERGSKRVFAKYGNRMER